MKFWKKAACVLIAILILTVFYKSYASYKIRKDLKNRALVVVVETNSYLSREDIDWYYKNKKAADFVVSMLTPAKYSELQAMPVTQILDVYVEDMLGGLITLAGRNYGRKTVLTDEDAKTERLEEVLVNLKKEGYFVDMVVHAHGGDGNLYLLDSLIDTQTLSESLRVKEIPFGYVYSTACSGHTHLEDWVFAGAKVVNGSQGTNSFVIFAPVIFEYLWARGTPFEEAVNRAYNYELKIWRNVGYFVPGITEWLDADAINDSKMVVLGDGKYTY